MSDNKVCKCGQGYVSARDGKCGHCRTRKEAKVISDQVYREGVEWFRTNPL